VSKRNGIATTERVTLQTIADRLGVSRTTISNAYGRPHQLAPALRDKILETAKELGYSGPHAAARSLRMGKSNSIGLLVTTTLSYTVTDPAAVAMLQGFAEVFDERGLSLLTLPAPRDETSGVEAAKSAVVDGFLIFCVTNEDQRLRAIMERNIPVVAIDEPRLPGLGYVGIDDRAAAREIAAHLVKLGHRRFGVLSLAFTEAYSDGFADLERQKTIDYPVSQDRLDGYAEALAEVGIAWETVPVYECGDNSVANGERAFAQLLNLPERPTAVLVEADMLALGVLRAARMRGIKVPEELSVAGFDDIPQAIYGQPPLTTVRQPLREKGVMAARMVVEGWENGQPPELILPTELVIRASTGPAPA
jgi:DNA-binding LacI/PurR family transcriptional regulator